MKFPRLFRRREDSATVEARAERQREADRIRDDQWRADCAMLEQKIQIDLEAHRPRFIPGIVLDLWRPER